MEVDPEDVKRHLEILGYTHIEPYLLNEFVKDLKKLIEYDRKHNVSALSSSLAKDWEQSYSDRMKTNTANERAVDQNCQIASADKREFGQNEKQKNNTLSTSMSSTTKNQYSDKEPKCYFCGYQSKSLESQSKLRMKHNSNHPHSTLYISVKLGIEL